MRFTAQAPEPRFWANVKKTDACWLWLGNLHGSGYGRLRVNSRSIGAHRFSYELHYGVLQPNQHVCHRCDNRACVNPAHLFAGTQNDNMQDMIRKGRKARGAASNTAKLTEGQVLEIREMRKAGLAYRVIAEQYGVHLSTIAYICRRKLWSHI